MNQRGIKFRAWDKKTGKMLYPQFVTIDQKSEHFPWTIDNKAWENDLELMQYTGLKDKNREEIYEGDVVKVDGVVWRTNMP